MLQLRLAFWTMGLALTLCLLSAMATPAHAHGRADAQKAWNESCAEPRVFGYTKAERRNFPTCYGGYERYYGGFHANYFRNYPVKDSGINNNRYGWGSGWAW